MEIRTGSAHFELLRGGGPREVTVTHNFTREVRTAIAGIAGYSDGFGEEDHNLRKLQVELATVVRGDVVDVRTRFGLRDEGDYDDDYGATVRHVLLADLLPAPTPSPTGRRTDLSILDVEVTQAIQYFHSAEHLDSTTAQPDNSIPLIARKPTTLRVWVDWDAGAGGSPISELSGLAEIGTSEGTAAHTIAPMTAVTPRRASQIDRGSAGHTLDFQIPPEWCYGDVGVRIEVFDAANTSQTSEAFQRSLRFTSLSPCASSVSRCATRARTWTSPLRARPPSRAPCNS